MSNEDPRFEALLDYLKRTRNFDFSGYKRTSLIRRAQKRMEAVGISDYIDYIDFLEVHPEEFSNLFNTILINVTNFFRDESSWEYIAKEILPSILTKSQTEPIRIWSAGCASGEEAYTIAILLCEALGTDAFQQRVKIYATDVDDEALAQSRTASYSEKGLEDVPVPYRDRYFLKAGDRYLFRQDLRRCLIFGRHDLVQDAPISRLDLLICRNTLMYLNAETQARILARFHFALNESGFLFLGKAEMLLTHTNLFTPTESKFRVFNKTARTNLRDRLMVMAQVGDSEGFNDLSSQLILKDACFETGVVPYVVIDAAGILTLANERARSAFGLNLKDIGRPIQDLELSYRPVELRSLIDQCYVGKHPMKLTGVERRLPDGQVQYLDVNLSPLTHNGGTLIGVSVAFIDVSQSYKLAQELLRANKDLETANEELQSAHEELETTNEELQSTNEELETTNEELQSTNEELETMNEELQSTNEELETINAEQRQLTGDLNSSNNFLNSILTSMSTAVVVLDEQNKILVWNPRAEDLWGLRQDEVKGQQFLDLDIGLPVQQLKKPLSTFSNGKEKNSELVLDAVNRRGKSIKCEVTISALYLQKGDQKGLILLMDER